tara:strand:- start:253 stop:1167 length:915 start_codon:yes stop_codon:yes gene_type:complete
METISMETIPASKNVIIDLAFGGLKVIAGQKYEKGDIVSINTFIEDNNNGVHLPLFNRTDIVPYGEINYYTPQFKDYNVELASIDKTNRIIKSRAVTDIEKGDILSYKSFVRNNPINYLKFTNYIKKSTIVEAGNGLFAGKNYKKGDIVSINPIVNCPNHSGPITHYVFNGKNHQMLNVQGDISIMNDLPNQSNVHPYNFDYQNRVCIATAKRDIVKDEELFISYGDRYWRSKTAKFATNKTKNILSKIKPIVLTNSDNLFDNDSINNELINNSNINNNKNTFLSVPQAPPKNTFRARRNGMLW